MSEKLICPVEKIKKPVVKIDIGKDNEDIIFNIKIKNPVDMIMDWANKKLKEFG